MVASRSYVSYTPANLKGKLNTNPFSFIHIINPDYNSTSRKSRGKEKFRRIREKYLEFIRQGIFKKEAKPVYYLYEQRFHEHTYIGVIAGISVADYQSGHILKHEATLQKRENMFAEYLKTTGFNAEPVLLTHRGSDDLRVTLEHQLFFYYSRNLQVLLDHLFYCFCNIRIFVLLHCQYREV